MNDSAGCCVGVVLTGVGCVCARLLNGLIYWFEWLRATC